MPFWPPFRLHFGSPGPQKKLLKVCNSRQIHTLDPLDRDLFQGAFLELVFSRFFPFVNDFAAKMCQNGLPTWPPGGGHEVTFPPLFCPGGPWAPKWLQGLPQGPPGPPQATILGDLWSSFRDCCSIFPRCLASFCTEGVAGLPESPG